MNKNVGDLDRKTYIGGSDAAAILGVSPWKTPLDVWMDKTSVEGELADPAKQKIFARGKRMEPYIIDILQEETGIKVVCRNQRYRHARYPFIAAEIDAETREENIEIKTANQFTAKAWGEPGTDEVPIYYIAQAMHGMMVTGRKKCIFGVLIGLDDFRVYNVDRDEEIIDVILAKELAFWEMLQNGVKPEPVSVRDINRLFARDNGVEIEGNAEMLASYNSLKALKSQEKSIKEQIASHEDAIKIFLKDNAAMALNGNTILTWKTQESSRFDQKACELAHPEIIKQFKKTTKSRVLRLK